MDGICVDDIHPNLEAELLSAITQNQLKQDDYVKAICPSKSTLAHAKALAKRNLIEDQLVNWESVKQDLDGAEHPLFDDIALDAKISALQKELSQAKHLVVLKERLCKTQSTSAHSDRAASLIAPSTPDRNIITVSGTADSGHSAADDHVMMLTPPAKRLKDNNAELNAASDVKPLPQVIREKRMRITTKGVLLAGRDMTKMGGVPHFELLLAWDNVYVGAHVWRNKFDEAKNLCEKHLNSVILLQNVKYKEWKSVPQLEYQDASRFMATDEEPPKLQFPWTPFINIPSADDFSKVHLCVLLSVISTMLLKLNEVICAWHCV